MAKIPGSEAEMYLISVESRLHEQIRTYRMPDGQIRTKTVANQLTDKHYPSWVEYVKTQPFDDE